MTEQTIRFDDGKAYERAMGVWSQLAGNVFLDWLAAPHGQRWLDVGCGNGAFTELLVQRCAPGEMQGIDPSEAQISYARGRPTLRTATLQQGDAMALPFPADRFDAAAMALVIFFVPEPPKGVAEMARVVRPGGIVAAYAWDIPGGGLPFAPLAAELREMGRQMPLPPNPDAGREEALRTLWKNAGLEEIETREITVRRTFADFDDFWAANTSIGSFRQAIEQMGPAQVEHLIARVRARLPSADTQGRVTYASRANAIKGRVPA